MKFKKFLQILLYLKFINLLFQSSDYASCIKIIMHTYLRYREISIVISYPFYNTRVTIRVNIRTDFFEDAFELNTICLIIRDILLLSAPGYILRYLWSISTQLNLWQMVLKFRTDQMYDNLIVIWIHHYVLYNWKEIDTKFTRAKYLFIAKNN